MSSRWSRLVRACGVVFGLLVAWPSSVYAQHARELVVTERLAGAQLGRLTDVLVDETGKLTISDIVQPAQQARFRAVDYDAPSFGFTEDVYWLRLQVSNRDAVARSWLLEVAYPHLDHVTLYRPNDSGGFRGSTTGDHYPFSQRDLDYRNFVFELVQSAHSQQTIYLRLQTTGSMTIPLHAWTLRELFLGQASETPALWMYYGLLVVMAGYNLFLFAFVRQREHLLYAMYVLSMGLMSFTLNGHTFQYLLQDAIWLESRLVPLSITMLLFWVMLFVDASLRFERYSPVYARIAQAHALAACAVMTFSAFAPYVWSIRVTLAFSVWIALAAPYAVYRAAQQGSRVAKLLLVAWGGLIAGAILYLAQSMGLLPSTFVTRWGMQLGAAFETLLVSVALADRINNLRADLNQVNRKLTERVEDLKIALTGAEQATRAKSEFLATMSHELRTPLNAIINIPQGLAEGLRTIDALRCAGCGAEFELASGESVAPDAVCPECAGQLAKDRITHYTGELAEMKAHLGIVERAGKHLLQMVNGILDHSKLEAGHVELRLERFSLATLIREAMETVSELAGRSGVKIELAALDEQQTLCADPLRVKQVLINLLGNAIKFSAPKSAVHVAVEKAGDAYIIEVRDEGIGIGPGDLERVFLSFEQVDRGDTRKYGGTGLGLSISRTLVTMHGGEIWVRSELGKGASFFVRLPEHGPLGTARAVNDPSAVVATTTASERLSA